MDDACDRAGLDVADVVAQLDATAIVDDHHDVDQMSPAGADRDISSACTTPTCTPNSWTSTSWRTRSPRFTADVTPSSTRCTTLVSALRDDLDAAHAEGRAGVVPRDPRTRRRTGAVSLRSDHQPHQDDEHRARPSRRDSRTPAGDGRRRTPCPTTRARATAPSTSGSPNSNTTPTCTSSKRTTSCSRPPSRSRPRHGDPRKRFVMYCGSMRFGAHRRSLH